MLAVGVAAIGIAHRQAYLIYALGGIYVHRLPLGRTAAVTKVLQAHLSDS
ncbi:hypothetical protein MASR1M65_25860 [Saprospiraceae bacterium]